jgi:hypothetical protein
MTPEAQYIRQSIPVEIESGKPITIQIQSLSGNGANDIGIRCSPEVWKVLGKNVEAVTVRLKSSDTPNTEIGGIGPRRGGGAFLGYIPNVNYLFYISGEHGAKASVEITFPDAPPGKSNADIIVGKTPIDTKPPNW